MTGKKLPAQSSLPTEPDTVERPVAPMRQKPGKTPGSATQLSDDEFNRVHAEILEEYDDIFAKLADA